MQGGLFNRSSPYTIAADAINRFSFQADYGLVINYKKIYLEYCQSILTKEFNTGHFHRRSSRLRSISTSWKKRTSKASGHLEFSFASIPTRISSFTYSPGSGSRSSPLTSLSVLDCVYQISLSITLRILWSSCLLASLICNSWHSGMASSKAFRRVPLLCFNSACIRAHRYSSLELSSPVWLRIKGITDIAITRGIYRQSRAEGLDDR